MELEHVKNKMLQLIQALPKSDQQFLLLEVSRQIQQEEPSTPKKIFGLHELEQIFDQFPMPIVLSDDMDNNLYVNPKFEEIMGYSQLEIPTSEAWVRLAYPEKHYRKVILDKMPEITESATVPRLNDVRCKDGQIRNFLFQDVPITKHLFLTFIEDVSAKFTTEKSLAASHKRFRKIVEHFPFPIVVTDKNAIMTYINPSFSGVFGYTIEDLPTSKIWSLKVYPDINYRNEILEQIRRSDYNPYAPRERRIICKNGETKYVIMQDRTIGEEDITFFRDITAQRLSEKEVQRKDQEYRDIVEYSRDMIFLLSVDLNIRKINPAVVEILGFKEDELINHNALEFISPEFYPLIKKNVTAKLKKTADKTLYEIDLTKNQGGSVSVEVISRLIYRKNQIIGTLVIARDISHRKKIAEERFRQQKIESIGLLAGGLAHDFNNILVSILGNIDLLQMDNTNFNTEQKEICHDLKGATLQARDLTKQLLTFSKGGTPILKPESIENLIQETANFVLRGSPCKCNFFFQPHLPAVDIDASQINQVLNNLIINARQAMPHGGIIDITVSNEEIKPDSIIPLKNGQYIKIQIADQGNGIPKENHHKIFDPYFTTKIGGNGLGLTMSYSIVKKHAGYITFRSEQDEGTTFDIYLPVSNKLIPQQIQSKTIQTKHKGRILVLDDDTKIHTFLHRVFTKFGYDMESCYDGAEVLSILNKNQTTGTKFQLIFMDLTIPGGIGGKQAIKDVKDLYPDQKVVVFSGYSNDPILAQHQEFGFCDYLVKPFTIQQLKTICEKWI